MLSQSNEGQTFFYMLEFKCMKCMPHNPGFDNLIYDSSPRYKQLPIGLTGLQLTGVLQRLPSQTSFQFHLIYIVTKPKFLSSFFKHTLFNITSKAKSETGLVLFCDRDCFLFSTYDIHTCTHRHLLSCLCFSKTWYIIQHVLDLSIPTVPWLIYELQTSMHNIIRAQMEWYTLIVSADC